MDSMTGELHIVLWKQRYRYGMLQISGVQEGSLVGIALSEHISMLRHQLRSKLARSHVFQIEKMLKEDSVANRNNQNCKLALDACLLSQYSEAKASLQRQNHKLSLSQGVPGQPDLPRESPSQNTNKIIRIVPQIVANKVDASKRLNTQGTVAALGARV